MELSVDEIRKSMRISHDALDGEIRQNIQSCLAELERVGIDKGKDSSLIYKACELYCKWQFDYQGKSGQYKQNFEQLRDAMSLAGDYKCMTK